MEPSGIEQPYDDLDAEGKNNDQEAKRLPESEQKLSKITHNALENINVIGQGLKQLFQQQRRRSSVSPHDVQQVQTEPEPEPDLQSQSAGAELDGLPQLSSQPTALNRVLLQIRAPPKMKRGTSLHSRKGKADPPKGSPQFSRKSGHDMISLLHSGRPRSSSTTDAPSSTAVLEIASASSLPSEEPVERFFQHSGMILEVMSVSEDTEAEKRLDISERQSKMFLRIINEILKEKKR